MAIIFLLASISFYFTISDKWAT